VGNRGGESVARHAGECGDPAPLFRPQGAKLIGLYDSQISFGQDRVLLVWTRLIMPNGRSIVLERQPGADTQGFAGLEDEVDQHWGRLFTAGALSTPLGVGSELGATNNDNSIVAALRRGSTDSLIDFSLAMVCAKQPHNIWLAVSPAD
jgi:type IV secretion system protein VirB10